MDNKKKTRLVVIIGIIILSVLVLVATTYSLIYEEKTAPNFEDYSTGLLSIEAKSKSGVISLEEALPMSDEDGLDTDAYIFTIKNNGNVDYKFDIKLLSTNNNTINPQYIKLKIDDDQVTKLSSLTNSIIKSDVTLKAKESMDVSIKIWLDINTPNTEIDKDFNSKIVMEGQAIYTESNYDAYDSLPEEYQRLEYIESSGTQYINNAYTIPTDINSFEMEAISEIQDNRELCLVGNESKKIEFGYYSTYQIFYITTSVSYNSTENHLNRKNHFKASINQSSYSLTTDLDGGSYNEKNTKTISDVYGANLLLLAYRKSGSTYMFAGKIYNIKFMADNVVVRDFIPCYRKLDNEVGFYDIANDIFYENAGTGEFTAGPEV